MAPLRTHLTVLEQSAAQYPDAPAFRVPRLRSDSDEIVEWDTVTYIQFWQDVQRFARHWTRKLTVDGIPCGSVVGLWYDSYCIKVVLYFADCNISRLGGMTYVDAVHIYSIARAGYIPQYFSLRLPNPDIIFELLERSNGRALIYDSSYASVLEHNPVPTHTAVDVRNLPAVEATLPLNRASTNGDDTLMIFHTSGSTSGRPKLVPVSYAWWDFALTKIHGHMRPKTVRNGRQDVTVWMYVHCISTPVNSLSSICATGEACAILASPSCSPVCCSTGRVLSNSLSPLSRRTSSSTWFSAAVSHVSTNFPPS